MTKRNFSTDLKAENHPLIIICLYNRKPDLGTPQTLDARHSGLPLQLFHLRFQLYSSGDVSAFLASALLASLLLLPNFANHFRLGTPMCIDQFGWTEEETILNFGILVAGVGLMCIFLFASVGPLVNRIDERKIMMAGILLMLFGRIFNFPIPGGPLPPLGNGTDIQDSNMMSHYARYYRSAGVTNTRNIPCEDASNTVNPGCELDWCETIPAITVWQLFGGVVVGTIGYPYALSITQSIFSKMLGPRPQVNLGNV